MNSKVAAADSIFIAFNLNEKRIESSSNFGTHKLYAQRTHRVNHLKQRYSRLLLLGRNIFDLSVSLIKCRNFFPCFKAQLISTLNVDIW